MTFQKITKEVTICDKCGGEILPENACADYRYWSVFNSAKNTRLHFHYICAWNYSSVSILEMVGAELHGI